MSGPPSPACRPRSETIAALRERLADGDLPTLTVDDEPTTPSPRIQAAYAQMQRERDDEDLDYEQAMRARKRGRREG